MAEKIEVDAGELKALMEQNRELMRQIQEKTQDNGSPIKVHRPITKREVSVRFISNKPVIGFANKGVESRPTFVYKAPNPSDPKESIEFVDVILLGDKEPIKVPYLDFLRDSDRRQCTVLETKEEPWEIEQGSVRQKSIVDYSSIETDIIVPVLITGVARSFVVLIDGNRVEINEKYVNM
jgi:hypothetical protein